MRTHVVVRHDILRVAGMSCLTNNNKMPTHTLSQQIPDTTNAMPSGTSAIAAGLYIAKTPSTSYAGINLANSTASHPLLNCLFYYSNFGSHKIAFNNLMKSGIVHPTGVLFIPFLVATSTAGRQE